MNVSATVTEVLRNFSDYISRVAYRGERFVLTRGGRPVAELVPAPPAGRRLEELPDVLARLPRLGEADATDFSVDLERGRAVSGGTSVSDPWAS